MDIENSVDSYEQLKLKCQRQAEYIERNKNKAKRCGEQQKLLQNAICKLRQHNKDLLSIIRSQKRELAEKGRAVGRRNNHIVQLQKELDNAIYQVCEEIREFIEQPENSIFYDESLYVETEGLRKLLDKLEKGEENERIS